MKASAQSVSVIITCVARTEKMCKCGYLSRVLYQVEIIFFSFLMRINLLYKDVTVILVLESI